jgi:hypothetical protein
VILVIVIFQFDRRIQLDDIAPSQEIEIVNRVSLIVVRKIDHDEIVQVDLKISAVAVRFKAAGILASK